MASEGWQLRVRPEGIVQRTFPASSTNADSKQRRDGLALQAHNTCRNAKEGKNFSLKESYKQI